MSGKVTTVFFLAPGTRVAISRNGAEFKRHTLRRQLQFAKPILTTETQMMFSKGGWRVRVNRGSGRYSGKRGSAE